MPILWAQSHYEIIPVLSTWGQKCYFIIFLQFFAVKIYVRFFQLAAIYALKLPCFSRKSKIFAEKLEKIADNCDQRPRVLHKKMFQ
jgi:hypothetical protein